MSANDGTMELGELLELVEGVFGADPDDEDESDPEYIRSLLAYATDGENRERIADVLLGQIAEKGENFVALAAGALVLGQIGNPAFGPPLLDLFEHLRTDDVGYEENQSTGQVALALAALGHEAAVDPIRDWLTDDRWTGSVFFAMCRYALWLLTEDAQSPLDYITDPGNKAGLSHAAAALADLHATSSVTDLKTVSKGLKRPAVKFAFEEAIERLQKQAQPPPVHKRMVWMLGVMHPTEIALGAESDDVFASRARDLPPPEADEDPPDDR
jgi:HEAT repeat protein